MKPKIHILFPSEWVAYSPTILNLVAALKDDFEIIVTAFDNGKYNNNNLDISIFNIVRIPYAIFLILSIIGIYNHIKIFIFQHLIKINNSDIIIGVDNIGFKSALKCKKSIHFLSLELSSKNIIIKNNINRIASIAIQTEDRLNYLFPQKKPNNIFLLPNSFPHDNHTTSNRIQNKKFDIIFFGNVIASHGVFHCIDSIEFAQDISLTIKGPLSQKNKKYIENKYDKLIQENRLHIDTQYINNEDVVNYLQKFDAGFCFYDFDLISKNDFNYISSPSGKMYAYFAATVPVIGSDIIGLKPVKEFSAGILLDNLTTTDIQTAINKVKINHNYYKNGCIMASKCFNFTSYVQKYKQFLLESAQYT